MSNERRFTWAFAIYATLVVATLCVMMVYFAQYTTTIQQGPQDTRQADMLYPTAMVLSEDGQPLGTGVLIHMRGAEAWVITAKHVVDEPGPVIQRYQILFEGVHPNGSDYIPTLRCIRHPSSDLALLVVEAKDVQVRPATLATGEAVLFEECYSVSSLPYRVLTSTRGYFTGIRIGREETNIFNAPIQAGASGGGVFVRRSGAWQLVGIQIGMEARGFHHYYHVAYAISLKIVREFVEKEVASAKTTG